MNKALNLVLFGALLVVALSCNVINKFTGNDPNLKKTAELWSDVPRMEGLASSEAEMPASASASLATRTTRLSTVSVSNLPNGV